MSILYREELFVIKVKSIHSENETTILFVLIKNERLK